MTPDTLLSMPMPQNPVSGFYKDKLEPSDSAYSNKTKTGREPDKFEDASFLSTLRNVSRHSHQTEKTDNINGTKRSESKAAAPKDNKDKSSERTAEASEDPPVSGVSQENDKAAETDPVLDTLKYMDFIKMLEDSGFSRPDGGSDGEMPADSDSVEGQDLTALEMLMAKLQQNGRVPSSEMKAAFERLRQFIAETLEGNTATGNAASGQLVELSQESVRILQWLKELSADSHPTDGTGTGEGEGGSAAKLSDSTFSDSGRIFQGVANSIDLTADSKAGVAVGPAENAEAGLETRSQGSKEPEKGRAAKLSSSAQINGDPKANMAVEKADAETSRSKEAKEFNIETGISSRRETDHQKSAIQDRQNPHSTGMDQPAEIKLASGGQANGATQTTASEASGSGLLQETQSFKDGDVKAVSGMKEETVGKVIGPEAGTNDSGLLNLQSPAMEKSVETALQQKGADADRSDLKTQALDQIVQKAAIHLRDGQHEARIDLKPEYLGHIRMQVISEDNQVTIKIQTEHGFVKDMIQNNAHQLKADLQHQGLNIDKLEVTVSHDQDGSGTPKDRPAAMRTQQSVTDHGKQENPGRDLAQDRRQLRRNTGGATTIDYFA